MAYEAMRRPLVRIASGEWASKVSKNLSGNYISHIADLGRVSPVRISSRRRTLNCGSANDRVCHT